MKLSSFINIMLYFAVLSAFLLSDNKSGWFVFIAWAIGYMNDVIEKILE
tara:strand:- start:258 stop:404 length:147 start_codon:yes stop_codon:yes gene_type:complete